jgi:hypothetical protein
MVLLVISCSKTIDTKTPLKRAKYYRVKQVDQDGKDNYSDILKVKP